MLVIPIVVTPIHKMVSVNIVQVWMFLERNGTHAIYVDSVEDALAFAKENGFPLLDKPIVTNDVIYLLVDSKCKELASFYSWGEIQPNSIPMKEVWRPFLWVKDEGDVWGTNQYLNEIKVSPTLSVYDIVYALPF
jgi:hypothetical protein